MTGNDRSLRSVQVRTTAVAMFTVVLVLTISAVVLVQAFERQQLEQVDRRLSGASRVLDIAIENPSALPVDAARESYVQVLDSQGTVVFASDPLAGKPALRLVPSTTPTEAMTVHVDGVGPLRVIALPLGERWLLFAETLTGVDDAVSALTTALLIGVPVLALVLGLVVWFVIGATLRPVQASIDRERRLVADVSHELRTPLAGARALLESESDIPAEIELNRLEALAVLTRLESMAADLLIEARNGQADGVRIDALVDLDDVVLRVTELVSPAATIHLDSGSVSAGQVRGNEQDLERMVSNLVTNALRHATSTVTVELAEAGGTVTLTVNDDGPGIRPEDRERVFERFTRLDYARSHHGTGAGLGLPIVRSVAEAHGGSVRAVDVPQGHGIAFVVTLPAADHRGRGGPKRTTLTSQPTTTQVTAPGCVTHPT